MSLGIRLIVEGKLSIDDVIKAKILETTVSAAVRVAPELPLGDASDTKKKKDLRKLLRKQLFPVVYNDEEDDPEDDDED